MARGCMIGVVIGLITLTAPAHGLVDMTGAYMGHLSQPGFDLDVDVTAVQAGTAVSITMISFGTVVFDGTIDPGTGEFSTTSTENCIAGVTTLEGSVAADSLSFVAAIKCDGIFDGTLTGTKCGNGTVDPGEACDATSSCCDDSCVPIEAGTSCPSGPCVARECDGAGACLTTGNVAAGTPCSGGSCNFAECDGTGFCQHTAPLECDGCSVCEEGFGCVADSLGIGTGPGQCVPPIENKSLVVGKTKVPDSKDSIRLKWGKGPAIDVADFGDPTVDTDYQLCVFMYDPLAGRPRSVSAVEVPAGAGWKATGKGFVYKSGDAKVILKSHNTDGKSKIEVKAKGLAAGVPDSFRDFRQFVANGEFVGIPPETPLELLEQLLMGTPVQVELRASNGQCWGVELDTAKRLTDDKIKVMP